MPRRGGGSRIRLVCMPKALCRRWRLWKISTDRSRRCAAARRRTGARRHRRHQHPSRPRAADELRRTRGGPAHLTFGDGALYRIGAGLARLELRIGGPHRVGRCRRRQLGAQLGPAVRGPARRGSGHNEQRIRAVIAANGSSRCATLLIDIPDDELRTTTSTSQCRPSPSKSQQPHRSRALPADSRATRHGRPAFTLLMRTSARKLVEEHGRV